MLHSARKHRVARLDTERQFPARGKSSGELREIDDAQSYLQVETALDRGEADGGDRWTSPL